MQVPEHRVGVSGCWLRIVERMGCRNGEGEGGPEEDRVDKLDGILGARTGSYEETRYLGRRHRKKVRAAPPIESRHPFAYIWQELCCPLIPSKSISGTDCAVTQENKKAPG